MATVYIVDDQALFRKAVTALLSATGHVVAGTSATVDQAVADLSTCQPDVALVDLALGSDSGLELLGWMRKRSIRTRAVVVTASTEVTSVLGALSLGVSGYLLKGAPSSELLRSIDLASNGYACFSPEVAAIAARGLADPTSAEGAILNLSVRERQVIGRVAKGQTSKDIGAALQVSVKTVDTYRRRLMKKLKTPDLASLIRFALRHGLDEV